MKRKIIHIAAFAALAVGAYGLGHWQASRDAMKQQTERDLALCRDIAALDRSFLKTVSARPMALTSGTYILQTTLSGQLMETCEVQLTIRDGQLVKQWQTMGPTLMFDGFEQEGQVVVGSIHDTAKGPPREYIGLIDGNMAWGRVYLQPGQGWHEGEPVAYGVWKLIPKPASP